MMTLKQSNSKFLLMNFNILGGKMFYFNELKRAERRLEKLEKKYIDNIIIQITFRNGKQKIIMVKENNK